MDIYTEYIIKHKKTGIDYAIIAGTVLGAILLSLILFLFNRYLFGVAFILIAFLWYGVYIFVSSRNIEFEYILTNGELDIDKIVAQRGRKRVITINFKEIEICANIHDEKFLYQYQNPNNVSKTLKLIGDIKEDNVYFVDFNQDGEKIRVLFQPNQKILDGVIKVSPRNIHA